MKKVFISFSSKETEEAKRICSLLEEQGFPCFIAFRDIQAGHEYAADIVDGLSDAEVMVLILSQASNDSPHVLREVEYAVSNHKPIIVYQVEDVNISKSMKYFLMTHQWIFGEHNKEEKLIAGVRDIVCEGAKTAGTQDRSLAKNTETDATASSNQEKKKPVAKHAIILSVAVLVIALIAVIGCMIVANVQKKNRVSYEVGDSVIFGSYQGEPIEWRVLQVNDDRTAYLISKDILCMRCYDTAEGGKYNEYDGVDYWTYENHIITDPELQILTRGNNDWSVSNIRTWLNSSAELVDYEDQGPTYHSVCLGDNSYSEEPGFLHEFTEEELKKLVPVEHSNLANVWSKDAVDGRVTCEDLVYLPSIEELSLFKEAGISQYASPTDRAVEMDQSNDYKSHNEHYDTTHYYYWLRDASESAANMGYIAVTEVDKVEEEYMEWSVGTACFGVRPAITIKY